MPSVRIGFNEPEVGATYLWSTPHGDWTLECEKIRKGQKYCIFRIKGSPSGGRVGHTVPLTMGTFIWELLSPGDIEVT